MLQRLEQNCELSAIGKFSPASADEAISGSKSSQTNRGSERSRRPRNGRSSNQNRFDVQMRTDRSTSGSLGRADAISIMNAVSHGYERLFKELPRQCRHG